jgi:hypothetical protein
MDTYDPDVAPDPEAWLALDEMGRTQLVRAHHAGRAGDPLHTADLDPIVHGALHALVETQVATRDPAIVGEKLGELQIAGVKRHAAAHAIMHALAEQLAALREGRAFDRAAYQAGVAALDAPGIVAGSLPQAPSGNRAERRARRKARGKASKKR